MKSVVLALMGALVGGAYYKLGTPSLQAYPAPDGATVMKLSFSRAPWFVAYFRTPKRALGAGEQQG